MSALAQTYPQLAVQVAARGWAPEDLTSLRRAYDLAATLFTARERGSGKPFLDHAVGTASGLVLDDAAPDVVVAGLLHAAYEHGDFGDHRRGTAARHREIVRAVAGHSAEAMVAAYHELGWSATIAEGLRSTLANATPAERDVVRVRLANEVDDALDAGLVLAGKQPHHAGAVPVEVVVELAEELCTPAFVATLRTVLAGAAPVVPPELVLGSVGSSTRLPLSARTRTTIVVQRRATLLVSRVVRRLRRVAGSRRS